MLRNVNSDILIKKQINAHQYFILFFLIQKQYDLLGEYLISTNTYDNFEQDLNYLKTKTLVDFHPDSNIHVYKSLTPSNEIISLLGNYNNFEELYYEYPLKVRRPDGQWNYLRRDRRTAEQLYSIIVKNNRDTHDHIVKCLKFEIKAKESSNSLGYMKTLTNWLSEKEWKNYEDIVDDVSSTKTEYLYGTEIE